MSTEKDTCQKSGTSVIFQKEITQPHCRIAPDEKALCKEAGNKLIDERVLIPDWCPLKTNKQK